jgi:MarR family
MNAQRSLSPAICAPRRASSGAVEFQCLDLVSRYEPITPGRLADLCGLRPVTVTGVLDRLETDGWVQRERDAKDRAVSSSTLDGSARPNSATASEGCVERSVRSQRATPRSSSRSSWIFLTRPPTQEKLRLQSYGLPISLRPEGIPLHCSAFWVRPLQRAAR